MALTLRHKLAAGFGCLVLFILAIGSICFINLSRMLDDDRWVDHTVGVIDRIQDLQLSLKRSQSEYRAYLLLRRPVLLQSAEAEFTLALKTANDVHSLTRDNPAQQIRSEALLRLLKDRWDQFQENQALYLSGQLQKALEQFKDPRHLQAINAIDKLTAQLIVDEQNLLVQRRENEQASSRRTLELIALGGVAATLFAFGMLLALSREVASREKAQGMVQLNEYRLFQFLEAIPLGVFVLDKDGRPFYANQKARELLGQGVVQASGSQDLSALMNAYVAGTDQPYPAEQLAIRRALKGEKCSIEDVEVHHPDGRIIPLQVWGTPVYGMKQDVQYALAIFSDITERRHVEDMKHSLVSVVSHQLKTPVGEINGYIENLLDGLAGALSAKQSDYLMDMREIGMNNYRLISDLLNLSKIERGLAVATMDRYPVMELVALAMRDYEAIMARKGLTLKLEGLAECPDVMADRDKMVETLRNLINNAIKFTDKGGLTISAEPKEQVVLLKVTDTGRGISDTAMAQLFQQKRVLGDEAGRAGAGLGLYVAKHFMKSQGGDISAVTSAGKGSCFTLTLRKAV